MTDRPVLQAIRLILATRNSAPIDQIAKVCGLKYKKVLSVIVANAQFVRVNRKNGDVLEADPRSPLRKKLRESGRFYWPSTYGVYSVDGHCLEFSGNSELRKSLSKGVTVGALGDSKTQQIIPDTDENREALHSAGLKLWQDSEVDDALWVEKGEA